MDTYHFVVNRLSDSGIMETIGEIPYAEDYLLYDIVEHQYGKGKYNLIRTDAFGNVVKKVDGQEVASVVTLIIGED